MCLVYNYKECYDWVDNYKEKIENLCVRSDHRGWLGATILEHYQKINIDENDQLSKWVLKHAVCELREMLKR